MDHSCVGIVLWRSHDLEERIAWSAGIAAIFIFWMLDAYYLMLERSYRKTFEKAVNDEKDLYDMRPEETERGFLKWVCCLKAAATAPVYVGLLLLGVIVIVCA